MIRKIKHENSTIWFVADDQGTPISFGYLTKEKAEEVAELIKTSEDAASIPPGIDVEKILSDSR